MDQPTRITSSTRTLIDHIFTIKPDIITNHGVLHVGISDHSLIDATHKHNTLKADPKLLTVMPSLKTLKRHLSILLLLWMIQTRCGMSGNL